MTAGWRTRWRCGIDRLEDLEDVIADVFRADLVAIAAAVQELGVCELVLGVLRQGSIDLRHVDEFGAAGMIAGQNLGHQHGDDFRVPLKGGVGVPVAAGSRHADLLAVLLDVG